MQSLPLTIERPKNRMEDNTSHGTKQQLPGEIHSKFESTNATKSPPKTG